MKRIASFIIILVFTAAAFLTGCTSGEVDRGEELKEVLDTANENLSEVFNEDECEYGLVSDYLETWANSSGVTVEESAEHYTVLMNPATSGNSKKKTTALQCAVHTDNIKADLNALSMGLSCLLGPNSHDNIRLIVTEINNGQMLGAESIPNKYLQCSDFININSSKDYAVYVSGPETAKATITTPAKRTEPRYSTAYKINLEFDKYVNPFRFDKKNNYPDPINTVGNLLASAISSGRLFEIAWFSSESQPGYMPNKVTAVVVIDDNNIEGFMKKFESSYSTVESRFDKIDKEFIYTMEETDMPSSVLADSTATELISLMYTLKTGICSQDQDTGIINAASYLDSISTKGTVSVGVVMRARSTDEFDILSENYSTTSGLCSMKYSCPDPHPSWTSSDESTLAEYFTNLVPQAEDESNIMLPSCELDQFTSKNKNLNAVSYYFVKDAAKSSLKNIINYIDKSRPE